MKDWKHSLFSFRIRLLAAGAGAALLAGTALPSVTAAFAGQQDALSGTTEAGAGQAGSQTDAGSSGALSSQTGQSTITDGGAGQSSDGGVPDGIDISGGGNGDGSLSNGSAQQTVGSDSSIPQQGSSADMGADTGTSESVPMSGNQNGASSSGENGTQNGASSSGENGTQTGITELLVFPEDLPIVFESDAELVTDEEKEPLIGKTDDGVYVLSGEKIQFRLDEAEAQKEWHERNGNDPKVPDRQYAAFDENKQHIEVLTSLLESVGYTYDKKTGIYTFTMPRQALSIRSIEKCADGVIVVPGNAGSVISEDARDQDSSSQAADPPDGITDEEPEDASLTAPEEQDGIVIQPESETDAAGAAGEVQMGDESESPDISGQNAETETEDMTETEGTKGLTFRSSDKKVAIVGKDGQITGVAPGTATISVYKDGKLKSQMKVTIR